jgi:poly-gamma-glutamate capsule biosynthesis protein CapA/YwtB (metallophosphatase superfamily)
MRALPALVATFVGLAACTEGDPAPSPAPGVIPSAFASAATVPLVLAVHPSSPERDLDLAAAEALVAGADDTVRVVAGPQTPAPERLRVESDATALDAIDQVPNTVAVVPATAMEPRARALTVDGRHPLREPAGYPLRIQGDPPTAVATLSIVGDLMFGRRVGEAIADDPAAPLRPTARRLAGADLTIGTFESTLSRLGPRTQGDDSFSADPAVLEGLTLAGFDLLSLANNHVGDFGRRSLVQTVDRLRAGGFATVGAGADVARAREPAVLEANGLRIGVLAFNAIGETPRARADRPGAVTLAMQPRLGDLDGDDLLAMTAAIDELEQSVDLVLVLPHWGDQYTPVAVRDQRRVGQALVAAGADMVVGSHPHVVQGLDDPGEGLVAYSLGNYVFDMDFSVPTEQGVILEFTLWGGPSGARVVAADPVPYRIGPDFAPRVLDRESAEAHEILGRIWRNGGEAFSPPR